MSADTPKNPGARVCETHGLVAADDGKCVLCRRADRPSGLVAPREETTGDRVVTVFLLLCMLGAVGALIWLVRQPRPVAHTETGGGAVAPAVAPPEAAEAVAVATDAAVIDGGTAPAPAPAPKTAQDDRIAEAAAKVAATRRTRIREARAKVKVRMYATRWCSICDAARFYLQAAEVDFEELRTDQDKDAAARLAKLNPQATVPTFTVGKTTLVGYNPYDLEARIDEAAREAAGIPAPGAAPEGAEATTAPPSE